jgi:phosphatidylglycerophosphate synthase
MTLRATLTTPTAGDPFMRVAGISVLLRQILSLQDAGVHEVVVQGIEQRLLPVDARITTHVRALQDGESLPDAALTARLGLVWHRALPRRLVTRGVRGSIETAPHEPDEFVIAVHDHGSAERAEAALLGALLKNTDGFISRTLNRPISLQITRLLLNTGLTPNQMTFIAALFGFAAIGVVLAYGVAWLLPGAVLLQIQSILDGCDGEISRLKYIRSRLGEWLDQVLDDVVNLGFFTAASWVLWREGSIVALIIGLVGLSTHLLYQISLYTALVTRGGGSGSVNSIQWRSTAPVSGPVRSDRTPFMVLKETVEMAGRRDFFTFFYIPAILVGLPELALAWCAIIFAVSGLAITYEWLAYGGPSPAPRG